MSRIPFSLVVALLAAPLLHAQVIQSQSAASFPGEQRLVVAETLPAPAVERIPMGRVTLLPGLIRERRELTKAYLLRLKTENLMQNHLLEAGVRIDRPSDQLHQGWEAPHCQLRGHFLGHWMAAAAEFAQTDHDPAMAARVKEVVHELKRCQDLNGDGWVASIPEEYLAFLADPKRPIWSPQYTLHKTLMGLFSTYRISGDKEALEVLSKASDWMLQWSETMIRAGKGHAVYGGECAGMLELWADLYGVTHDPRYLTLASRYAMPDLFKALKTGKDVLSNDHTNASIPWVQGAARLYEVTGDPLYRSIVESFWKSAVETRGMFATTGNNAGEFWIPPQQFSRFTGSRVQEHCTVYNMIRVADYLYRWTNDSRYADYIERALYNGILAQQHPRTGMICYFLPNNAGARKVFGSETADFWCCHGSLVQAQAMFEGLIYHERKDTVVVTQFVPSVASIEIGGQEVQVSQTIDSSGARANFVAEGERTRFEVTLKVRRARADALTLEMRLPSWARGDVRVTLDGTVMDVVGDAGHLTLPIRTKDAVVTLSLGKQVVREYLPGDSKRFALVDGPVVLAAMTTAEPKLGKDARIIPQYEHQYVEGQDWQSGHYLAETQDGSVALKPLFEVGDEVYTVHFTE